jgi:hypothetical protein
VRSGGSPFFSFYHIAVPPVAEFQPPSVFKDSVRLQEQRRVGRLQPNKQPPPALAAMRLPVNLPRLMGLRLVREKHMDNSQGDIDPDIFEYLSKLPPDILEEMANEGLRAQEDQKYREVLLPLSWECLKSYFISKDDFNSFIESFANPKDKKKFI